MFGWLGGRRGGRRNGLRGLLADDVGEAVDRVRIARRLTRPERERLLDLADALCARIAFEGCGGLVLEPWMKAHVALNACVPVLELGLGAYAGVERVLVYPSGFRRQVRGEDAFGIVTEGEEDALGEAWSDGYVVLSWADARPGADVPDDFDLVVHEFAHRIDGLTGAEDGRPPLHDGIDPVAWDAAFAALRDELVADHDAGFETVLDVYAAEDPAECFAVTSEVFFARPLVLAQEAPEVYAHLAAFYRQDPARSWR